jgi:hypothetical protein
MNTIRFIAGLASLAAIGLATTPYFFAIHYSLMRD